MNYYTDLFSPETYEAFSNSPRDVSGFRLTQRTAANKVQAGDRFICYVTRLSRWVGVLEILSTAYEDDTPIFYEEQDPFVVRFKVKPIAWLSKENGIPIHEDEIWNSLSFTKGYDKSSSTWTGKVRRSLNQFEDADAQFLEKAIVSQLNSGKIFELDEQDYKKLLTHRIRTADKVISVTVPEDAPPEPEVGISTTVEVRESIKIQALIASMGAKMGFKIWLPKNDRGAVFEEWKGDALPVLDMLPLNYDDTTLKTIERIDVLWLKARMIVRAFEVEHSTSIYSGMLRMADLLALQPNMEIKLHIVAPYSRREKVFQELRRPVFSLLDKGPLSESCTYISYDSLRELSALPHIAHTSDSILDEYAEGTD
ncbi:MAG: EVE domain-containing protein [Acidobacteriota bacterium]|nr:EVE domain-containing protein [Acidobacteriota bacterium]